MRRLLVPTMAALTAGLLVVNGGAATASSVPPAGSNEVHVYVDGADYHMTINRVNLAPSPSELAAATPFYVAVFPLNPDRRGDLGALTVGPNAYRPQCDPCFHPGLDWQLIYHDHIITGAPGFGNEGTAGFQEGIRHPIAVVYDPATFQRSDFHPLISADQVRAEEHPGGELLPVNPTAANPYELPQDVVVTVRLFPAS